MKLTGPEVFVSEEHLVKVDFALLDQIKAQAMRTPRQRARLCAHLDTKDRLHEMFIVMARDIYVRPHKHLGKSESFHVIQGAADIVFFDENGMVEEFFRIGDVASGKVFYFRNDEARYHTQIITSESLVVHEITNGPFNRAETVFAPWAPEETNLPDVRDYMNKLKQHVAGE